MVLADSLRSSVEKTMNSIATLLSLDLCAAMSLRLQAKEQ
jgi:hypothetical protein